MGNHIFGRTYFKGKDDLLKDIKITEAKFIAFKDISKTQTNLIQKQKTIKNICQMNDIIYIDFFDPKVELKLIKF